jgi:hypothetical protein
VLGELVKEVALLMELNGQEGEKVVLAAFHARCCLAKSVVESLKEEMTVRQALEWLLDRWETNGAALQTNSVSFDTASATRQLIKTDGV